MPLESDHFLTVPAAEPDSLRCPKLATVQRLTHHGLSRTPSSPLRGKTAGEQSKIILRSMSLWRADVPSVIRANVSVCQQPVFMLSHWSSKPIVPLGVTAVSVSEPLPVWSDCWQSHAADRRRHVRLAAENNMWQACWWARWQAAQVTLCSGWIRLAGSQGKFRLV